MNKAINTTVFKEYGDPDYSKVTKAINFAQENVSAWCMLIRCSVRKTVPCVIYVQYCHKYRYYYKMIVFVLHENISITGLNRKATDR